MLTKAKKILRSEGGMSIIIVLSISALFVALSAAVLYAASLQTASANRVLPQENAYRMAYTFTENVLEPDLKAKPDEAHPLRDFLLDTFLNPANAYEDGENYTFSADNGSTTGETVTITLRKTAPEGTDPPDGTTTMIFGAATTADDVNAFNGSSYTKYVVAMTVEVKVGGEHYALTKRYSCYARYACDGSAYEYKDDSKFSDINIRRSPVELDELKDGAAEGYYIWLPEGGEG